MWLGELVGEAGCHIVCKGEAGDAQGSARAHAAAGGGVPKEHSSEGRFERGARR